MDRGLKILFPLVAGIGLLGLYALLDRLVHVPNVFDLLAVVAASILSGTWYAMRIVQERQVTSYTGTAVRPRSARDEALEALVKGYEPPREFRGVLALTGPAKTGKTELAAVLAQNYLHCKRASFGLYVTEHAEKHHAVHPSHELLDLQTYGQKLVDTLGAERLTRDVLQYFGENPDRPSPRLVVDDVYHQSVLDELETLYGQVLLIGLSPEEAEQHQHLTAVVDPDADVPQIEHHPVVREVPQLLQRSSLVIHGLDNFEAMRKINEHFSDAMAGRVVHA
jgi:hypothetical protein